MNGPFGDVGRHTHIHTEMTISSQNEKREKEKKTNRKINTKLSLLNLSMIARTQCNSAQAHNLH